VQAEGWRATSAFDEALQGPAGLTGTVDPLSVGGLTKVSIGSFKVATYWLIIVVLIFLLI